VTKQSSNGIANSACEKLWKETHIILVDFLYRPLSDLKVAIDGKTINLETDGAHNNTKYHIISSTTLFEAPRKEKKKHTQKSRDCQNGFRLLFSKYLYSNKCFLSHFINSLLVI